MVRICEGAARIIRQKVRLKQRRTFCFRQRVKFHRLRVALGIPLDAMDYRSYQPLHFSGFGSLVVF